MPAPNRIDEVMVARVGQVHRVTAKDTPLVLAILRRYVDAPAPLGVEVGEVIVEFIALLIIHVVIKRAAFLLAVVLDLDARALAERHREVTIHRPLRRRTDGQRDVLINLAPT